jgi:lipoprotein-anchoring transpeptidase ErfK/SrfK
MTKKMSRRNFLKQSLAVAGGFLINPFEHWRQQTAEWPDAERLGRVCVGRLDLRQRPSANSPSVGVLYEDAIVVSLREVIGERPMGVFSKTWVETPDGYLYAPSVQPVFYRPNPVDTDLPETEIGRGFWAEVTVPYVDFTMANPPVRSPWLKEAIFPRLYYSQIMWVDDFRTLENGQVQYRVMEHHGSYGDVFWADATAFRRLTEEEVTPIHPEVEEKQVEVDLDQQTVSCYEGKREVYHCRISSGTKFDYLGEQIDNWRTPTGEFFIWRKAISTHMSGGQSGFGYDTPGIGWTCLFTGDGIALHSTFWHNNWGTPRSHGCINAAPDDAKWVFRWTYPHIGLIPGNIVINQLFASTTFKVIEA